ncbi:MAG: DUF4293 domain-containing protein [Alloprevotella sp.]
MIQRIQSVFLFLAFLDGLIALLANELICFTLPNNVTFTLSSMGYGEAAAQANVTGTLPWGVTFFSLAMIVMSVVTFFGYKNRKKQMKQANLCIASAVLWYVALAAYTFSIAQHVEGTTFSISLNCAAPALALVFFIAAKIRIRHDERLVRAADRIR